MKSSISARLESRPARRSALLSLLLPVWLVLGEVAVSAFPPALHHLIYGRVRDEWGEPLSDPKAEVILETAAGIKIKATVLRGREPGVNFALKIPMDAGLTADAYQATALRPLVPFKIRVRIGVVDYLPIQMQSNYAKLGLPGQKTRLDLTLGEDVDGDGLPDAWERAINPDFTKVNPGDDSDHDGMSNADEYFAGTYAFDAGHTFELKIAGVLDGAPLLSFTAIRGRSYSVEGSSDLKDWHPVSFTVPAEKTGPLETYASTDVRVVTVAVAGSPGNGTPGFFRLVAH